MVGALPEAKELAIALRKEVKESKGGSSEKKCRCVDSTATAGPPSKKQHTQSTLSSLTFCRNDMLYGTDEADTLQKKALCAVISTGSPFRLFEDPEMKILLSMLRTTAPDVIPTGKVVRGCLLDSAAEKIDIRISKQLKNRNLGLWHTEI
ncbi:hypothetical protein B0H10DRAFT_1954511 [Mycena sp. CBHHK59/15]|nr:hypothetical protein B0H10DRAFT_1954511 [Mycena sp. CBHHK59/15]